MRTTKLNLNSFIEFKMNDLSFKFIIGGAGSPPADPPVTTTSPPPQGNGDPRSTAILEAVRGTRP